MAVIHWGPLTCGGQLTSCWNGLSVQQGEVLVRPAVHQSSTGVSGRCLLSSVTFHQGPGWPGSRYGDLCKWRTSPSELWSIVAAPLIWRLMFFMTFKTRTEFHLLLVQVTHELTVNNGDSGVTQHLWKPAVPPIYTHLYICMHGYIYVCVCIYIYIYIYMYMYMYMYDCMYVCMYVCVCTYFLNWYVNVFRAPGASRSSLSLVLAGMSHQAVSFYHWALYA